MFPHSCGWRLVLGGLALMSIVTGTLSAGSEALVTYPEGYRAWFHVKTALVTPQHKDFERSGGFRHIYANAEAVTGYRSGTFPRGSTIVVDWIGGQDENGMFVESARRRVDVMVKDPSRFAKTGGWGFERFDGNSRTERTVTSVETQCFACHAGPGSRDFVFSRLRD